MAIIPELICVALAALVIGRVTKDPWRSRLFNVLKVWLTVRMVWLLLLWPVMTELALAFPPGT